MAFLCVGLVEQRQYRHHLARGYAAFASVDRAYSTPRGHFHTSQGNIGAVFLGEPTQDHSDDQ